MKHFLALAFVIGCSTHAIAQDDKDEKKEPEKKPRIGLIVPLAVAAGSETQVGVRGDWLHEATEFHFDHPGVTATRVDQGSLEQLREKSEGKDKEHIELAVKLQVAADVQPGLTHVRVTTPLGQTEPHPLWIESPSALVAEAEPNNGFQQPQTIRVGDVVLGSIQRGRDTDVFALDVEGGKRLLVQVDAAKGGSPLDPVLTLYDSRNRTVSVSDDIDSTRDCTIEFTPASGGRYFLGLVDALDTGSRLHLYRLTVKLAD